MGNTIFQDWLYGYDAAADAAKIWEQECRALLCICRIFNMKPPWTWKSFIDLKT